MSDQVRINGAVHSWASIIAKIGTDRYYGFTSISYGDNLESTAFHGQAKHAAPIGRTAGKYTPEVCTVKFRKGAAAELRKMLAALASDGKSVGTVEFDIVVQYIQTGDVPITDQIMRCKWAKNASSSEEGADALMDETTFQPLYIIWNKTTLFDSSQGMP